MGWDKQSESHSIITGLKLDKPLSSSNGYLMAEHQSNESRQVLKFCSKLNSIVHFFLLSDINDYGSYNNGIFLHSQRSIF